MRVTGGRGTMGAGSHSSALLLLLLLSALLAATAESQDDGTPCLPSLMEATAVTGGESLGTWDVADEDACVVLCCAMARCDTVVLGPQKACELFACEDAQCSFVDHEASKVRYVEPQIQPATAEETGEAPESEQDICKLPPKVGHCRARLSRWFYDGDSRSCQSFIYGGCKGNGNNFELEEQCLQRCGEGAAPQVQEPQRVVGMQGEEQGEHHPPTTSTPEQQSNEEHSSEPPPPFTTDDCLSMPDKGPCRGSHWRWSYSAESGGCEKFMYGGCQGNGNNFHSKQQCLSSCGLQKDPMSGKGRTLQSYEFCRLEALTGPCRGSFTRWVYTPINGSCSEFTYGGCHGNQNNFLLEAECLTTCGLQNGTAVRSRIKSDNLDPSDVCLLNSTTGPCRGSFTRWTYVAATSTCKEFTYGGCRGNQNNFLEEAECLMDCGPSDGADHSLVFRTMAPPEDICLLEEAVGPCRGSFTRWIYDAESSNCKEFTYGGCGGNFNNFLEETECMVTCGRSLEDDDGNIRMVATEIPPDVCLLEAVTGPCRGSFTRWTYDAESGHCKEFTYGGCSGNYNNFLDETECVAMCGLQDGSVDIGEGEGQLRLAVHKLDAEVCLMEAVTGPCRGYFTRWTYDGESGHCKEFTYGGCRGNHNNYVDEADCKTNCGPSKGGSSSRLFESDNSFEDLCKAEPQTGPCRAHFQRWYYSDSTGGCAKFTYGGCAGGFNNYLTEEICLNACSAESNADKNINKSGSLHVGVLFGVLVAVLMVVFVVWKLRRARRKQTSNGTATTNGTTATTTVVDGQPGAETKEENTHLMAELPHSPFMGKQSSV
ncbi:papilin-like isoform X3 [Lampetra fluviatilis]